MSSTEQLIDKATGEALYVLVDLSNNTFAKRAPLWEIQAWAKYLEGPDAWKEATKRYKRMDLLNDQQLFHLYVAMTGGSQPDPNTRDELFSQCQKLAQQVPVDETSIEELRKMLVDKGMTGTGRTQKQGEDMSTTETQVAPATTTTEKKEAAPRPKGAKVLVRELYAANPGGAYTVEEIASAIGKEKGSVTTAISDLKSATYCKPGDPLVLHRHKDGKYSLTAEVEAAAPAAGTVADTTAPPADVLPQV